MISRIIEFSAKNKFVVIFFTIAAIVVAVYCIKNMPLDAIPDLSDTQVIIYSQWDRSPDIIEQQVTYPIVTALLGTPNVRAIRGFSDFGYSYVYIIFKDGTDIYWARSRVVEYLSKITAKLPQGVSVEIGPDATGLGWVYQYALVDKTGNNSLADLRSFQDWNLRYSLQSVPGVADVAAVRAILTSRGASIGRVLTTGHGSMALFDDPDGNHLYLFQRHGAPSAPTRPSGVPTGRSPGR